MRSFRIWSWLTLTLSLLGAAFALNMMLALGDLAAAADGEEVARREYDRAVALRETLRDEAASMRSRQSALELNARREYRLVFPGERVELVSLPLEEDLP